MARCEVGPATVRLIEATDGAESSPAAGSLVAAALSAGDDALSLLDDRAVPVSGLWRAVFATVLGGRELARVELIHPSWWTATRVAAVARAAGEFAGSVSTVPRARAFGAPAVFVEIAARHVAVGAAGKTLRLVDRDAPVVEVLQQICDIVVDRAGEIRVDAPVGVPGAEALGAALVHRLRGAGRTVEVGRLEAGGAAAPPRADRQVVPQSQRRRRVRAGAVTMSAAVVAAGLLVPVLDRGGSDSGSQSSTATAQLVEGSLVVEIPADWTVQRIKGGPGSDRVQIASPHDPQIALHITASRMSPADLAVTSAALAEAVAAQPPGVFVDFDAQSRRAGRPAVTYREVRASLEIRWVVVHDGGLRIAIGCQSPRGVRPDDDGTCEQAVRSAHQIR
jgi:type VII secretion-associated protein (TIGR03931 family)